MVHSRPSERARDIAPLRHHSSQSGTGRRSDEPLPYVLIPDALIVAFAHDPLAIGIYVAIARLVLAAKQAVPLAARDLAAWMGKDRDADRAAVMRRIAKLAEARWLNVERSTSVKHRLLPTWGHDVEGTPRVWRFDIGDSGRPQHLRGRRVPLVLLDCYLGRLDPQPGHTPAVISRYFTRPLLDLADIGVYTISQRAEVMSTPRLRHLKLLGDDGAGLLPTPEELLAKAVRGELSIYEGDIEVRAFPSPLGFSRLTHTSSSGSAPSDQASEQASGSPGRSPTGTHGRSAISRAGGSAPTRLAEDVRVHPEAIYPVVSQDGAVIAWDVGNLHEPTNQPSPAAIGAGGDEAIPVGSREESDLLTSEIADPADAVIALLEPGVAAGHRALNPLRPIPAGEWYEVLSLQQEHGAPQLLIWQARAVRRANAHPFGITPAYYRACAVHDEQRDPLPERQVDLKPDPACDALFRSMGVRERRQLAGVPYDLIVAWRDALEHPGMAARFAAPLGFAVSQMRQGNVPPSPDELERWATHAKQCGDRYESWRHIEPQESNANETGHEADLEARVRALAPPGADLSTLCALARLLEDGVTDTEALAYLRPASGRGMP
jgi:hypothetical protein